jgi:branched-chain amino acid transport system substrate-binding protein
VDRLLAAGVDAIIGAASSGVTATVKDKILGANVIQFSPANTAKTLTEEGDLYFRTAPSDILQGRVLGDLVVADGNANAVILALDDPYGTGLLEDTTSAFEASGGTVLDSIVYDPQAQTFDAEVQAIVNADPDAVILIGFDETARILATMIEQGVGPDTKAVYGVDGNMGSTIPGQVDPNNPGVIAGMKGTAPLPAENQAFFDRLTEFQPDLTDFLYAAESYDAAIILGLAAEIAGTDEPSAVAEEIIGVTKDGENCTDWAGCMEFISQDMDIDYDGASGPLEFSDAGEPASGNYGILRFTETGEVETIDNIEASL